MTQYGVVWCTTAWVITANASIPCRYAHEYESPSETGDDLDSISRRRMIFYALYYNFTNEDSAFGKAILLPAPIDEQLLRLKVSVDNGIMKHLAEQ